MKSRLSRVSVWLSGVPTALVVALWLGLWQAWPTPPPASVGRRAAAASQVMYRGLVSPSSKSTLMQLAFVQAPAAREESMQVEGPGILPDAGGRAQGHVLERRAPSAEPPPAMADPLMRVTGAEPEAAFRPPFDVPRVFAAPPPRERGLFVDMSESLRARDFAIGAVSAQSLQSTNSDWQVSLRVVCGEDGAVEDVFVESGTTNQAFNLGLARRVQASGRAMPGVRCCGAVSVSYEAD